MLRSTSLRKVLLLGLLTILIASQAGAVSAGPNVWTSNGPEGGTIYALVIDPLTPATIYAGASGGIFKSTNGGGDWSPVNTGLTATFVLSLAIDPLTPATLYAGSDAGVFKSTDGGGNWSLVLPTGVNKSARTLAIDPVTPATLYAGAGNDVFKSTNGGADWSAANTGLTNSYIRSLAIDPVTPATLYVGTDGGVFKSTNSGGNWNAVNTGLTGTRVFTLAIDPATPASLYAGTYGDGVFKSTNGGEDWNAVNNGLTNTSVWSLAIDPATPAALYAGTWGGGVFKSTDGGGNWSAVNTDLTNTYVWPLAIDPATPATLYAGTNGGGVFKSTDSGGDWGAVNTRLIASEVRALAIDPLKPATIYAGTQGGVFKSTNGGGDWSPAKTGLNNYGIEALVIDPATPTTLYAGIFGGGVFKSTNSGGDWNPVNTGLTNINVYALAIDPKTPAILYVGTANGGMFKSTNGGGNWSALYGLNAYFLAIDPKTPTTIYAGNNGIGVFKSTNGGKNFSAVNTGLTTKNVRSLAIDPLTPTTLYAGTYVGVFKTTNGGGNWNLVNTGLTNTIVGPLVINPARPATLYAGGGGEVFKTTDRGGYWISIKTGLPNNAVHSLAIDPLTPGIIYAGTDGGVYRNEIVGVSHTISGSAGVGGAILSYDDGGLKTAIADLSGNYSLSVSYGWSGTVVPSKKDFVFLPVNRTYTNVTADLNGENYTATSTLPPPSTPALLTPSSNALITTYTPRLDWSVVTLPAGTSFDHYQLQVATDAGFGSVVLDKSDFTNKDIHEYSVTVSESLNSNTTYRWRVRAQNTFGKYGNWSLVRTFRTAILPPVLTSPIDTTTVSSLRPTFDWENVTGASGYTIQVSKNGTFTMIVATGTLTGAANSQYTPAVNLPVNLQLFWRVKANGINGPSAYSATWSITTPNPPGAPVLVSPAINVLLTNYTPTLKWSKPLLPITPGSAAFKQYEVQIATDAAFTTLIQSGIVGDYNTPQYIVSPALDPNLKYYWRVHAVDMLDHNSIWSTVRYFRTAILAPVLTSPTSTTTVSSLRPTFDWENVTGASGYTIQVSKNSTFTMIVATGTLTGAANSQYTPAVNLPVNLQLFWRVKANGINGPSAYSATWSITTPNPPGAPVLISPAINVLLTNYTPSLKWSKPLLPITPGSAAFKQYEVQIATDATFTTLIQSGIVGDYNTPQYIVSPALDPNLKYYWRVRAVDMLDHYSIWSTARTFRTALSAPVLSTPTDGDTTITSLRPPFDWLDVPGATSYTIQVSRNSAFTLLVVNKTTVGAVSAYTPLVNLPANIPLYWRVRANGVNGPSLWAPTWSFTVTP